MKYAELIGKMTLQEKAEFCSGIDFWHLAGNERLGIPSIMVTDGPLGLRKKDKRARGELLSSVPAVCFTACLRHAHGTRPLREMGEALGEERLPKEIHSSGPRVNISSPCGRNLSISRGPSLRQAGSSLNRRRPVKGCGYILKHFAANNQETRRMTIDRLLTSAR